MAGTAAEPFTFTLSPAIRPDGDRVLATLTITVAPDHHLYRERTEVQAKVGKLAVTWPPIQRKLDPFEGKEIDVFDTGRHEIGLSVSEIGEQAAVPLVVGYHGCSSITCFMPEETALTLAVPGAPTPAGPRLPAEPPAPAPTEGSPGTAASTQPAAADDAKTTGAGPGPASPERPSNEPSGSPAVTRGGSTAGPVPSLAPADASGRPAAPEPGDAMVGQVAVPGGTYDFGRTLREQGLLWALLVAFVGGFLVSLTPCVYPMIPITLSIIGGRQENTSFGRGLSLSVTYVAGLSLTYALLGLIVALFGAQVRGILQGATFQLVMAAIFVVLALSMFDLFMLQVPDTLRQKVAGLKHTGWGGVFVLGMVSGLMASPCVAAPLAGILAFIAASGSVMLGFTMLLAFAWGMGLILVVIGAFSGSLNALPKAGDWMVKVKEFYGFLLLGAAFYFAHPFIGTPWAALLTAGLLAAFAGFLGVFGPVSAENALSERVARCLGVVALAVACAFAISAAGQWGGLCLPTGPTAAAPPAGGAGLPLWHDRLEDGLAQAARENKPVFIDFRADWCTICKELERNVFPHPTVAAVLQKYVLVKIDATTSPPPVKAVLERFGVVGLPTLVILDPSGRERAELRVVGDIGVDDLAQRLRQGLRDRP